jgi:hypothetical protein
MRWWNSRSNAMSPDINRDGAFTRGVDVNLYPEAYAV